MDATRAITKEMCGIALKTIKVVLLFHVVFTPSQNGEYGL